MGLDQLLELTSRVASKALPILGVVALVFLIIFLYHLTKLVKSAKTDSDALLTTIDKTNQSIDKLQKPLDTLNDVSETIDLVHEASKNAVQSTFAIILSNLSGISEWFKSLFAKKNKGDDVTFEHQSEDLEDGTENEQ